MLQTRPVGIYTDIEKNRNFLIHSLEQGWIPLPMHDPRIFEKYPRVSENIVKII
jgi:hypothetical protein